MKRRGRGKGQGREKEIGERKGDRGWGKIGGGRGRTGRGECGPVASADPPML